MLSLQGRQCTQDLCSIAPVTCERHCQRGSHIQRKNSALLQIVGGDKLIIPFC